VARRRHDACSRTKLDETQGQETAGKSLMKVTVAMAETDLLHGSHGRDGTWTWL
jgi:hypothetical protein